ncbi:MAG: bifunctional helix-turn-helix transcriptional regulator/GNAT family N-acetyltransferase [Deltaproteobacteria bacterium]|nr:bifunctional helix-turn-helix transcriptional regulator/GNAT family N-acetyltransferase [Deltaproteobacteria bacterium]
MDFIDELGLLALGSRLRRLSDRIMSSGVVVYRTAQLNFEPRWFPVFRVVADRGELTVGECARALGLTHAAVSQTVRRLSDRGLVQVSRDTEDERRRLVSLSDEGRTMLPQLRELWEDIEGSMRDAVDYGGIDILTAVQGLESALAVQSLSERVADRQRSRVLDRVEVIEFEPALAEHFARLNLEWLEKYFTVEPVDHELFANPGTIIEGGGAILFARVGEEIVGTCALLCDEHGCELTKMAVTEQWQGQRIGAKLLEAAIERARGLGVSTVHLITNSTLVPAINLYRQFGFRVTRSGPHPKYDRGDLSMELSL